MADEDPFAEPDDTDKTVIRPNPGGRRNPSVAVTPGAAPQQPSGVPVETAAPAGGGAMDPGQAAMGVPQAQAQASAAATGGETIAMTGMNPLNACATPLFSLISRIRNRAQHMDPDKLRQSVVAEVRAFENRALQSGIDAQQVKVARYAICATLDDVVLNTPWGGQSSWAMQSMVGTFHRETVGGDRFFDLLARLEKDPGTNIDLLEFLYQCLSLGFEGRLRVEDRGGEKHLAIRQSLARIIRGQRGVVDRDLSPHWTGVDKPYRALSAWRPVWIAVGVSAVILSLGFAGLSWALGRTTENVVGQLTALDAGIVPVLERRAPPPPPPPPDPVTIEKFVSFLDTEIAEGIVTVLEDGNTLIIRMTGAGMFGSGSDVLSDTFKTPIARVAQALSDEPGAVVIVGHSDNIPIRSGRWRDNAHLSLARAEAVKAFVVDKISDPARILAEGRADKDPIADNGTPEGRAKNRRIEFLLVKVEE